jgi:tetratricopeptide (TPR) repeat protein
MKGPLSGFFFVLFAFSACAWAQGGGRMGSPMQGDSSPSLPSTLMSVDGPRSVLFVTGKVVLEDGGELTEPVAIQTICKGQRRTETYSDRRGSFSFQLGDPHAGETFNDASNGAMGTRLNLAARRDSRDCQLEAVLAGFSSKNVDLGGRLSQLDNLDVGRVPLHRLEHVDGTSISVTSALAPSAARKALEKARQKAGAGKWSDAQHLLEKAVRIYPQYAVAWCELGRVQLHDRELPAAEGSFNHAVAADAKYVNPYEGLAQVAVQARDWLSVIEITDKLLTLNPVNFPDAYFFNAAAKYYLKNLDAAEKSALQGIRVDEDHQIPKLQYLLAIILLEKHDYLAAEQHIRQYIGMVTQPAEIETARKTLAEITTSSAGVESASVSEKK